MTTTFLCKFCHTEREDQSDLCCNAASLELASILLDEALHQLWHAIEDPKFDKSTARRAVNSIQERAERIWPINDGDQDGTNTPGADKYWNW